MIFFFLIYMTIIYLIIGALVGLQILDLLTTNYVLSRGGIELNTVWFQIPILNKLPLIQEMVVGKIIGMIFIAICLLLVYSTLPMLTILAGLLVIGVYIIVVINNAYQVYKSLKFQNRVL